VVNKSTLIIQITILTLAFPISTYFTIFPRFYRISSFLPYFLFFLPYFIRVMRVIKFMRVIRVIRILELVGILELLGLLMFV
jgi:hypothetical protein